MYKDRYPLRVVLIVEKWVKYQTGTKTVSPHLELVKEVQTVGRETAKRAYVVENPDSVFLREVCFDKKTGLQIPRRSMMQIKLTYKIEPRVQGAKR